jgi:flagellar basal body P-ring formation protein FlgA
MTIRQRKIDCARAVAVLLTLFAMGPLQAQQAVQDVESIRASATAFVRERLQPTGNVVIHAQAAALDPRLRLAACTQPVIAFSPAGEIRAAARTTIGVRCNAPAWSVYVPVTVESELPVLVTTRALPRNAAVTAQDVELKQRRVPGAASGYLVSVDQLTGRHLRNAAAPGTALDADLLSADVLIKRGQRVTVIATAGSLEVRAQGEAVADATPDGRVRVLNLNSRRIVEGQVESRDSVRVSL